MNMDEADDIGISFNHLSIVDSLTADEYIEIDNNLVSAGLLTEEEPIEEILLTEGVLQGTRRRRENSRSEYFCKVRKRSTYDG